MTPGSSNPDEEILHIAEMSDAPSRDVGFFSSWSDLDDESVRKLNEIARNDEEANRLEEINRELEAIPWWIWYWPIGAIETLA